MRFGLIVLLFLAGAANAQEWETTGKWECQSGAYWSQGGAIVVEAIVFEGFELVLGSIYVAGKDHIADYYVEGFNRRWDFGERNEQGNFPYSFVIAPDGEAAYYDFTNADDGMAKPSQSYVCKQTE